MAQPDPTEAVIVSHMKQVYHLAIGERTAERIKLALGPSASGDASITEIPGRDMASALSKKAVVPLAELREAVRSGG